MRVGKRKFLEELGVGIPEDLDREAQQLQEKAQTVVLVAVDENAAGLLAMIATMVIASYFPARRASRVSIVEALAHI